MRTYKGNVVLIELVIVLIFFALSQVAIVQVFAAAQQKTNESRLLNEALLTAQDAAEQLALSDDPEAGLYRYQSPAGYAVVARITRLTQPNGALVSVQLSVQQGDATLFTLPVNRYAPGEVLP